MKPYLLLLIAIISEVIATTALKASRGFSNLYFISIVVAGYALAFYFLSLCMQTLPLGITYVMWAGLGSVGALIAGAVIWNESLNLVQIIGVGIVVAGVGLVNAGEQNATSGIEGVWLTSKRDAKIEIFKNDGAYFGKLIWVRDSMDPGTKTLYTDNRNPDKSKRDNPLNGLIIVKNLIEKGHNKWINGKVYDPETGKEWDCEVILKNNSTLELKGFWKTPLFSATEKWIRLPVTVE